MFNYIFSEIKRKWKRKEKWFYYTRINFITKKKSHDLNLADMPQIILSKEIFSSFLYLEVINRIYLIFENILSLFLKSFLTEIFGKTELQLHLEFIRFNSNSKWFSFTLFDINKPDRKLIPKWNNNPPHSK